jgi:glycosyltransferase involved in cell wall biosynthesis
MRTDNRLHIHMLAPFGLRPKGTLAVRMLPMARALVRRGYCVQINAPPIHNPQDAGRYDDFDGVGVWHTPLPRLPAPANVGEYVRLLLRPVLADPPDVLHLFKPKGYSGLAALAARVICPHLSLVVDTDDWEGRGGWNDLLDYPPYARALFAWQERDLPRRADVVSVASRTLQTQVWGGGVSPERVFYLPNGIASLPPALPLPAVDHPPTLLLYTRFWEFDVRDIIAMLVPLCQECPALRLRVVGKGERGEERDLMEWATRAGVAEHIDNVGWVEPGDIPALLASADIALVPMDDTLINRARCSVKLLELMAAGLPVVAGRVGEVAEYLEHEQSGLLVAPGRPAEMVRATLRLLHNESFRAQLGAAARRRAGQFHWDSLVEVAEQAYAKAREKTPARSRERKPE